MSQLRIKCPSCGTVQDIEASGAACKKCSGALILPEDGVIQIYRMGSPMGIAVGMGIYINENPMGHLANASTIKIPVAYGHYKVHMTHGTNRKCQDAEFDITPDNRVVCLKAHLKMGFISNKVIIEQSISSAVTR
ncbi:MAG: hypothetical protein IKF09_01635 [Clostridiales bacterium]|nr:hypothetical protein [Clostridiales bacterium]